MVAYCRVAVVRATSHNGMRHAAASRGEIGERAAPRGAEKFFIQKTEQVAISIHFFLSRIKIETLTKKLAAFIFRNNKKLRISGVRE